MAAVLAYQAHPAAAWLVVMQVPIPTHARGKAGHAGHTFGPPVAAVIRVTARQPGQWGEHPRAATAAAVGQMMLLEVRVGVLQVYGSPPRVMPMLGLVLGMVAVAVLRRVAVAVAAAAADASVALASATWRDPRRGSDGCTVLLLGRGAGCRTPARRGGNAAMLLKPYTAAPTAAATTCCIGTHPTVRQQVRLLKGL